MFVHTDNQLRAAHMILDYISISKSFQAPKCVIKAKDPRLHWISVAAPGFLITSPIPEGTFATTPILEGIPRVALPFQRVADKPTSSQPTTKEEEEEEDKEVVEVTDSEDEFSIFNQPLSPKPQVDDSSHPPLVQADNSQNDTSIPKDMGI